MPLKTKEVSAVFFKSGISELIDNWAAVNNTTRHKAAKNILAAAIGEEIKVSFDDSNIIVHFPALYVDECHKIGKNDSDILEHCVHSGIVKLNAG